MNKDKVIEFIKKWKPAINTDPIKFLNDLYGSPGTVGLNSDEEDYLAYSLMYIIGKKYNYTFEFYISELEESPIGFSIRCLENNKLYWYSDLEGDEYLGWLKELGFLNDILDLPQDIIRYFKQFKITSGESS